jgi:hypothetical protein
VWIWGKALQINLGPGKSNNYPKKIRKFLEKNNNSNIMKLPKIKQK